MVLRLSLADSEKRSGTPVASSVPRLSLRSYWLTPITDSSGCGGEGSAGRATSGEERLAGSAQPLRRKFDGLNSMNHPPGFSLTFFNLTQTPLRSRRCYISVPQPPPFVPPPRMIASSDSSSSLSISRSGSPCTLFSPLCLCSQVKFPPRLGLSITGCLRPLPLLYLSSFHLKPSLHLLLSCHLLPSSSCSSSEPERALVCVCLHDTFSLC